MAWYKRVSISVLLGSLLIVFSSSHQAAPHKLNTDGLVLDDLYPKNVATLEGHIRHPYIYIYDFGEKYCDYRNGEKMSLDNANYALVQVLPRLMSRARQHITTNPDEADFFFPHVWPGFPISIGEIIELMRKAGPWWDRKKGTDHFIPWAADEGRCNFHHDGDIILVNHFGMMGDYRRGLPCDLTKVWGAQCDTVLANPKTYVGCHRVGVDMIVPSCVLEFRPDQPFHRSFTTTPYTHLEDQKRAQLPKATLLFHGGQVDPREHIPRELAHIEHYQRMKNPFESMPYSFGARQTVARLYDKVPGFVILHHNVKNYSAYLETATFCLATAGSGWSSRYKVAITHGCIPVIVQDGTLVDWEEVLPIHEYAIRVPMWMVHRLDEILHEFVKQGIAAKMQKKLDCVWRLHWWRRPYGRAFELTMCELKRRALGAPKVELDFDKCTLKCGDDRVVDLRAAYNNV